MVTEGPNISISTADGIITRANATKICDEIEARLDLIKYNFHNQPYTRRSIIGLYALLSITGAVGNALVITAVVQCPHMRTIRNCFIALLAVSDFFMSTITLPFSMKAMLIATWDLGNIMCKLVSSIQTVNVFVSTMSIAAISADRYVVIMFPLKQKAQKFVLITCALVICFIAVVMALPMYFFTGTQSPWKSKFVELLCGINVRICTEDKPTLTSTRAKLVYSIFSLIFQYCLPLFSLIFLNHRISKRLDRRPVNRSIVMDNCGNLPPPSAAQQRRSLSTAGRAAAKISRFSSRRSDSVKTFITLNTPTDRSSVNQRRNARIKRVILAVVFTFGITWLPFNIYMLLVSVQFTPYRLEIAAFCHIFAMTSACANPIIYGALNENFRQEFNRIAGKFSPSRTVGNLMRKLERSRLSHEPGPDECRAYGNCFNSQEFIAIPQTPGNDTLTPINDILTIDKLSPTNNNQTIRRKSAISIPEPHILINEPAIQEWTSSRD